MQSYQRVIDSISDKAQNLVQASSDPQLARFVSQTSTRYQKLSDAAKVDTAGLCNRRIINRSNKNKNKIKRGGGGREEVSNLVFYAKSAKGGCTDCFF